MISGVGIALAFNTGWMLLSVLAFALLADRYMIEKEEKYLAAKFGEAYSN